MEQCRTARLILASNVLLALWCAPAAGDAVSWDTGVTTGLNAWAEFGTRSGALDGYDAYDLYAPAYISFRREQGQGWDGPTGYLVYDYRAPLEGYVGASKTWSDLYVTHSTTLDPTVSVYFGPSSAATRPPAEWLFELFLDEVPEGVVYNGPYHWYLNPWGDVIELPPANYDPAKPIPQGYRFSIKVTVIPEPCSLIAMGVGLAALGLRRRR